MGNQPVAYVLCRRIWAKIAEKMSKNERKIEETTNVKSWFSYETKISIDFELKVEKIDIFLTWIEANIN